MVNVAINDQPASKIVSAVVGYYKWADPVLNYGFKVQDIDGNGVSDFDEGKWRSFYKEIFDNVSTFTKLSFKETPFSQSTLGQILEPGGGGQSSNPYPDVPDGNTYTVVRINGSVAEASEAIFAGRWSDVWYHEIGHSLGLSHSFDRLGLIDGVNGESDLGTHVLNSSTYTVMSYSAFVWGEDNPWTSSSDVGKTILNASVGSFMPIDVAGLQHMYGARAHNTGDNVYTFGDDVAANRGYTTIWDTGGNDTVQYTGRSRAKIDLRDATLKDEIGGGGFLSTSETLTGGFLIANGVSIENAIGGAKNDVIHGQGLNNLLVGHAGNDTLYGYGGNDRLDGGTGSDRLDGGAGIDQALFAGSSGDYAVIYNAATGGGAFIIKHLASGALDRLVSIESLVFNDTTLDSAALFANPQSRFGAIAPGSRAKFDMKLSPGADDGPAVDVRKIDGAFTAFATARFDDLAGGSHQRVFDTGNGQDHDNIWLGQVGDGDDMAFEILTGSIKHRIVASDAIVQGESAKWQASVDDGGWMRLFKNDLLVAEGQGSKPLDVVRDHDLIGRSNWSWDTPLVGRVDDLFFV